LSVANFRLLQGFFSEKIIDHRDEKDDGKEKKYYIEQSRVYPLYLEYCKENNQRPEGKMCLLQEFKKKYGELKSKKIEQKVIKVVDGLEISF